MWLCPILLLLTVSTTCRAAPQLKPQVQELDAKLQKVELGLDTYPQTNSSDDRLARVEVLINLLLEDVYDVRVDQELLKKDIMSRLEEIEGKVGSGGGGSSVQNGWIEYMLANHYRDFRPSQNFTDSHQPTVHRDCQAAYYHGWRRSGVYTIKPDGKTEMSVYCDQELDGGGWVVIQRRFDGSVNFGRRWQDYRDGFGQKHAEYWLGNQNIHLLTNKRKQKLRVELQYRGDGFAEADYSSFSVGSEAQKFQLKVSGFSGDNPPDDSLLYHDGQYFSTKDRDQDNDCGHCAQTLGGGWWYKNCSKSNLNGVYGSSAQNGIVWKTWKGDTNSLQGARMLVKGEAYIVVYKSCQDAYDKGQTKSGVYRISPDGVAEIDIYCEQEEDGGGWAVFQRRFDGSTEFYRTWTEYKDGFGDVSGEFWLGLDYLHLLTAGLDMKLRIEMASENKTTKADFNEFWISDENQKYQLHVDGFSPADPPGDSFGYHNNQFFSTMDRDHDQNADNCAEKHLGAWWYADCYKSNLNGVYGNDSTQGIIWETWQSSSTSLSSTKMMIKTYVPKVEVYKDCQTAYNEGHTKSGVFKIKPDGVHQMDAFCEQQYYGGGWTVLQTRVDGSVNFYRNWKSYAEGFGDLRGEFWLGNENINYLTANQDQKLRIELEYGDEIAFADYKEFWIEGENEKFQIHISGFSQADPPGDSMAIHNGQFFSTEDRDYDNNLRSCAKTHSGAWWYNSCFKSNLNGVYGMGSNKGILWDTWKGGAKSLTGVRMMVKTFVDKGIVHKSCQDAYEDGRTESGVYTIKPDGGAQVDVYCEMDLDDGGWTVFQRRSDGSEDFYKDWNEYKNGFGNVAGEFWFGNENLHLFTSDHKQKLKIEMKLAGETAIVDYASFWVGKESENYKLHVAGFSGAKPPGDSLLNHSSQAFSTQDQDNDASSGSCARMYTGAWWYKSCYESNLNGKYGDQSNTGVVWKSWKGASTSLTSVRMMFKTVKVYRDCHAAYNDNKTKSGVYRISPDGVTEIDVYCEMQLGGGGWTVFQRRFDGTVDFQRTWSEYKRGFGSIDSEYWLGNDIIHLMTVNQDQKLMVEIEHGGLTAYAEYSEFWIENEAVKYQLHVDGFSNGQNNPGDSLQYHNKMFFTTKDRDNDPDSDHNRAVIYKGAWWHTDSYYGNLNTLYGDGHYYWGTWPGHSHPLTASRMMLKTK